MTRIRWATLALATVAGVVGIAGPAAAATPVASVQSAFPDCDSLQQQIDAVRARIDVLQELLSTATPAQKPGLIKRIGQLEVTLGKLERQLPTCTPSA
jgi:hypothetical protein